jgi:hypothetical protein
MIKKFKPIYILLEVRSGFFCTNPRIRNRMSSSGTHNTAPRTKAHPAALGYSATSEENAHPYRMKDHPLATKTDRHRTNPYQRSYSQSSFLATRTDKRHESREERYFEASLKKEWWNRRPLMDQGNRQQQVGRDEADHFLDTRKEEKRRRIEHILVVEKAARKRTSDPFVGKGDSAKRRRLPDDPVVGQIIDWRQTEDDRHGPNIYEDTKP